MALYTHCLVARKEAAMQDMQIECFTEKEYGMVRLENVGDVLFQALLLDSVKVKGERVEVEFYSILCKKVENVLRRRKDAEDERYCDDRWFK